TEIVVDHFDLRPAQRHQAIPHGILQRAALAVVQNLMSRRLAHIEQRLALQMVGANLLRDHGRPLPPRSDARDPRAPGSVVSSGRSARFLPRPEGWTMWVHRRPTAAGSRRTGRTVAARCAGRSMPSFDVSSCWLARASPTSSLREAHDAPQGDALVRLLSASRTRSDNALSSAMETWGVGARGKASRQAARSNIQAGSSSRWPPPPVKVQRKTMPSERLTVSWTATRRPNQGCQRYRTSLNSVPWAFSSVVVQHSATAPGGRPSDADGGLARGHHRLPRRHGCGYDAALGQRWRVAHMPTAATTRDESSLIW